MLSNGTWHVLARGCGRRHKAWSGAEGGTPGQVWSAIKPVKRAAATGCRPLRGLRSALLPFPWGLRPRLYAVACSAGSKRRS